MADFVGTNITNMLQGVMGSGVTTAGSGSISSAAGEVGKLGSVDPRIGLWNKRASDFDQYAQAYQSRWSQYWKWYRAWKQPMSEPLDWWRSNEVVPTVFKIIETLYPRAVFGIFDDPDWANVHGTEAGDEIWELSIQQLIKEQLEEMQSMPTIMEGSKYCEIMGHVWWKLIWKEEWRKRQMLQPKVAYDPNTGMPLGTGAAMEKITWDEKVTDRPNLEWCSIDRIKTMPNGSGRWYIEEIKTTLEELREEDKRLGGVYSNLDMVQPGTVPQVSVAGQQGGWREPESTEGIPQQFVDVRDGTPLLLWQCWGYVPPHLRGPKEADWRLCVIANRSIVLRDVDAPTPDGKPPYFGMKSIPIPGQLFGESIIHYIGPLANQQTRLANHRLDEVMLSVWGQLIIDSTAGITNNEMFFQPGGALFVNGSPRDKVMPLDRRPLPPETYREDEYRQMQAEHAAGASPEMQGLISADRPTTGDTQLRTQAGNQRVNAKTLWYQETFVKPLLTGIYRWLQMRMPDERVFRVVASDGMVYDMPLDIRSIQVPIDITVGGNMSGISKQTRIEQFQEMIQLAASPVFGPYLRPDSLLIDYLKTRGKQDAIRYVKTQQEVMGEMAMGANPQGLGSGVAGPPDASGGAGSNPSGVPMPTPAPPA